ncbi:MAG: plasmid pRiA4b ORF-3 family protein [Acidimicrobiales bacterium]
MLIVRGTKKLRDRLKGAPAAHDGESTAILGDWFANALFWRPQAVLLVNERTLLPVFVPLAPAATLLERVPAAIEAVLRRHGASEEFLASEREAMRDVRVAPTNNRCVLGVMNEYAYHGEIESKLERLDLDDLSLRLSELLLVPLQYGTARQELAHILGLTEPLAKVIPFPDQVAATPPAVRRSAAVTTVYQLKVTLLDSKPAIWRRILVDGDQSLDQLHEVIQAAFGWWNYHLHEFEVDGERYGIPDPDWDFGPPTRDERRTRLSQIAKAGDSFRYNYDFGDDWRHKIAVEKVVPADPAVTTPACVDGRRACPPEDCGGTWGYRELLEILTDPTHPEHDERREWIGRPFDPEVFDPSEFDDNLRNQQLASFDDEP